MKSGPELLRSTIAYSALGQRADPPIIARLMAMALETPGLLSLAAGFTDNATLPADFIRSALETLAARAGEPEHLQYGTNQGRAGLRRALAERVAAMDAALAPPGEAAAVPDAAALEAAAFVTNGSQQALYLAMQVLCEPGDIVLVDRPSYFVYLEMLRGLGARARSLPLGEDGRLDEIALGRMLDALSASGEAARVKAVYFVSYFSNPSGRSLDEDEKNTLAHALLSRGLAVPVVEDAAYRELYFDSEYKARGVLSLPAWEAFPKLYTATLTKPFATGLKTGFGICSDREWLEKMLHVKGHHDFGSANFNQAVLEHALAAGDYDRQLARIRPVYAQKMGVLHGTLADEGLASLGWKWRAPSGGLYLWLEAPRGLDTGAGSKFCHACIGAGVLYVPGDLCFGDDAPGNFIRLSYGVLGEGDLAEAARRFAGVARAFRA
ncbi:PLP-dependent aminotransferase family protein [Termitidicoccus mucosus]|uniref:GntR family transcriptional regulator n=1 Tax=Termitidicoccus mucosus TaxID=1184151 RepID=A0A178IAZ8_9BACT|nr:GntR family transcriptional regulator [Opitutaceae bacterium TSB47]